MLVQFLQYIVRLRLSRDGVGHGTGKALLGQCSGPTISASCVRPAAPARHGTCRRALLDNMRGLPAAISVDGRGRSHGGLQDCSGQHHGPKCHIMVLPCQSPDMYQIFTQEKNMARPDTWKPLAMACGARITSEHQQLLLNIRPWI